MGFKGRSVISVNDFSARDFDIVLKRAEEFKNLHKQGNANKISDLLKGKRIASLFFEPSTRTEKSFDAAIKNLGAEAIGFGNPSNTSVVKGEPLVDSLRMFENYDAQAIIIRHNLDGAARFAADSLKIPIINAGDGKNQHPTQTMLDLLSIKETQGKLDGLKIGVVGDLKYGRTTHSLVSALTMFSSNKFYFVSPDVLKMPLYYLDLIKNRGHDYEISNDLQEVAEKVDILYMTRIQQERFPDTMEGKEDYDRVKNLFSLHAKLLKNVKPNLKVLHPLPRNKNAIELDYSVDNTEYAYYIQQAQNGIYIREALLDLIFNDSEIYTEKKQEYKTASFQNVKPRPSAKKGIIAPIENGIVIDHIAPDKFKEVSSILGLKDPEINFSLGRVTRTNGEKKLILKVSNRNISESLLNMLAVVTPDSTVSFIEHSNVVRKGKVKLPEILNNIVACPNSSCISNLIYKEGAMPMIYVINREPAMFICHYCNIRFGENRVKLI